MKLLSPASIGSFRGSRPTTRGAAWRLVLALAVMLASAAPVSADGGLTGAVAASYFPRAVDAGLHSIAHQRVLEISSCPTCLNHRLMRAGTSEVLAYNLGSADPIGDAVRWWVASPVHHAILANEALGSIGCAQAVVGATTYFACVLAPGGVAVGLAPQLSLPDTSTRIVGSSGGTRALVA